MKLKTCTRFKWPGTRLRYGLSLILMCFWSTTMFGQTIQISGVVKSELDNDVLPGVNVVVKGTTNGTVTDLDGRYSLEVPSPETVLVFSFIGFGHEEVRVGSQSVINVVLTSEMNSLDEVVVIGYGTTKRQDVTGSISSVSGEDIRRTSPVTIDQALQGKVPGVVIQQASGQPGGAVNVQVRGLSFGASNPLYVIDGVIMGGTATLGTGTNPLAGINPSEIESIDVLKDASATAIYGSQATNGVIVITTKRGKESPPSITYEFYTGVQQLPSKLPLMNLQEYASFINERNSGMGWGFDERPEFANPEYLGKGTDWQKELFRNAPMSNHTITVSGGDRRTQYLLSGSYFGQEGIALGSDFRRVSLRLNLDNKTTDWLKIGTSLQLVNINENVNSSSSNVINTALSQTPDIPVTNADGSWGGAFNPNGWVNNTVNPYAIALINKDEARRNQLFGNVYSEISITKDLTLRNEVTGSFSMATQDRFFPTYTMGLVERTINSASFTFAQSFYSTARSYLTYARMFGERYNVNVMGGHEAQLNKSENSMAARNNFPSNNVQVISSGDPLTATNSGSKTHSAQESYFGRINLGLDDKYLLTGNIRADGSSRFAAGNRWVTTYSGALAWKINNEGFMKDLKDINELKLRVGYGLTNNQNIRDFAYTSTLGTVATGLSGIAQLTRNMANPLVEWERTHYSNIGLDGTFFNWRLNFSVDLYDRNTEGLLMQIPLPLYSGTVVGWSPGAIDAPFVNVGEVNNRGIDFRISSKNIRNKNFVWTTDLTVSRNVNKVINLLTDEASLDGQYSKTIKGRSIGEFYGYVVEGVFAQASDFETYAIPVRNGERLNVGSAGGSVWYGDLIFKDLNGDGIIDENDQTFLGSPIPKFQLGLNNSFSYKNFDLNVFFNANYGNKVYNRMRINGEFPGTSFGYMRALNNYAKLELIDPEGSASDINNVYVSNPDTRIVGIRNDNTNDNNRTSDKFVEDGSFIRCRNISLGYTFSEKLIKKAYMNSLRVYVNVTNAFLLTNYKGMDPEIGSWNPLNAGVDSGFYPQPRVFTVGASVSLNK
ncbi:TonB-dependent receptor [Algoriphagus sp. D3-2-R+10]|uniref:SusC/RagA family TonB-linked outer membrane protein n=1 Tax=Algoriphagus aurantiacus TaxID=3103948 RepID=UPI002B38B496|nr:TonB-dependent receptor [Algoriphagus sp. D3-2-R+10]MEB2775357.1 TonB-dependent receptor [Algoriphagus sp. D3-2-R+10]